MQIIRPKSIYTVAKKEFLDNIRNKWVIVLTILLFLLVLVFSYVAGGQSGGGDAFGDMQNTVIGLLAISPILIPIIAIILGFGTISSEAESGALYVVMAYPVTRLEILLGKFLGLGFVIIVAVLAGFGIGGILITATVSADAWTGYLIFMALTIFLGLIYLSLSICVSAYCKRRITSIGGGLVIFFWAMIIGVIWSGILYGNGYTFEDIFAGKIPDWYWIEPFLSPGDMSQSAVLRGFGINHIDFMGTPINLPDWLNMGSLLIAHIIWFIIPLILAYFFFKRRDI